jgi:beta-glucosidase
MADVDALVGELTLEEKAALTAGGDMFATAAVERLGIPRVNVTDGPSGARGQSFPGMGGAPSTCIPCGSAVGAAWDPGLAEALGALVGQEALDRGCRGLLAPTVNLHRHPLAGRNFECYSEDPLLTGKVAAGYVRGVQSRGVFATVKHFVANEAEFERMTIDSVVDERSLRELYLLPFELAVEEGGALGIMTSYNRVNGRWVTEQPGLLVDLLRGEWGFAGLVMTDWFAVADTATSLAAGLDLEMPAPGRALGAGLVDAVEEGIVDEGDLDTAVRRLLGGLDRIGALGPEPPDEPQPLTDEGRTLIRRAAAEGAVLLTNDGVLPVAPGSVARVAVIGAPATSPCVVGGGSAQMALVPMVSPLAALRAALGDSVEVVHERGADISRSPRLLGGEVLRAPDGFEAERFAGADFDGEVTETLHLTELRTMVIGLGQDETDWSMRVRGTVVPDEDGSFTLALAQSGRARVFVDGAVVLDGVTDPPPPGGSDFFGQASQDLTADVDLRRDESVEVVVEFSRAGSALAGFRVGFRTADEDTVLERAVAAAAEADVALVLVGTNEEWETEGRDRESFALPGRQDELVRRVAAANPRTAVVVNAAAPVDLPWSDEVAAVLQCWFAGQEIGPALADVLTGAAEPGGRLATTIPVRVEHSPAHDNFPGENGELRYGEGLFMGYRGFDHRAVEPRFAFGHGLGYTTFALGEPTLSSNTFTPGGSLTVSVPVTNTGDRAGSEVVQLYVAPQEPRLVRPPKELKAFAKVRLGPGASTTVELTLDDRSFAYWDPGQPDHDAVSARVAMPVDLGRGGQERRVPGWQVDPGRYELLVGRSSRDLDRRVTVEVIDG